MKQDRRVPSTSSSGDKNFLSCLLINLIKRSSTQPAPHQLNQSAQLALNVLKCFSIPGLITELSQVCLRVAFKLVGFGHGHVDRGSADTDHPFEIMFVCVNSN